MPIVLELPNTKAVRDVLRQIAGHACDDAVPFFEEEEPDPQLAEAWQKVADTITHSLLTGEE